MKKTRKTQSELSNRLRSESLKKRWAEKKTLETLKAEYVQHVGFKEASTSGWEGLSSFLKGRNFGELARSQKHTRLEEREMKRLGRSLTAYEEVGLCVSVLAMKAGKVQERLRRTRDEQTEYARRKAVGQLTAMEQQQEEENTKKRLSRRYEGDLSRRMMLHAVKCRFDANYRLTFQQACDEAARSLQKMYLTEHEKESIAWHLKQWKAKATVKM